LLLSGNNPIGTLTTQQVQWGGTHNTSNMHTARRHTGKRTQLAACQTYHATEPLPRHGRHQPCSSDKGVQAPQWLRIGTTPRVLFAQRPASHPLDQSTGASTHQATRSRVWRAAAQPHGLVAHTPGYSQPDHEAGPLPATPCGWWHTTAPCCCRTTHSMPWSWGLPSESCKSSCARLTLQHNNPAPLAAANLAPVTYRGVPPSHTPKPRP
jgi:hypothetical protein